MSRLVFVVDDEKTIADTLAAILTKCGYKALPFYNAESALAECDALRPDLVISDVVMPGMNGVDMAVIIRRRYPSCRILLFSGQAATANILEGVREKGYEFDLLAKPIHPKDLLAHLQTVSQSPVSSETPAAASEQRTA